LSPTARWLSLTGIELVLTLGVSLVFFAVFARRSPLAVFRDGAGRLLFRAEYRRFFVWVVALPIIDIVETSFDDRITAKLGYQMTGWIHRMEGDWASVIQRLEWPPATFFFTFIYVIVLPVLLAAPIILAAAEERKALFRGLSLGLVINYIAGLPFYFFFPVKEMWAGNPGKVQLLMDRVSPLIMESYRANSALDNCFPSLHTSLALTVPLVIGRAGGPAMAVATWATAILVAFSTLYLGIHWASDVAAGALLAVLAAAIARRLAAPRKDQYHAGHELLGRPAGCPGDGAALTPREPER
jgi:membrane-associated phospholipid phosphatase